MTNLDKNAPEITLLISKQLDKQYIAVLENYQVKEIHQSENSYVGHIYQGKVVRILPGMEAAFIDIGLDKAAYLPLLNALEPVYSGMASLTKKGALSSDLKQGQYILVQVVKDSVAEKGVKVTTKITLTSSHLVMHPLRKSIKISKKIKAKSERERLGTIAKNSFDSNCGWLFRTSSSHVKDAELNQESFRLQQQWQDALDARLKSKICLLHKEQHILTQFVLDRSAHQLKKIYVDSNELMNTLKKSLENFYPHLLSKFELYEKRESLFESFNVHKSLKDALLKTVLLPSGGSMVCESTEAMTVIDINTGSHVGQNSLQDTIYQTNFEAAVEIAHQIRLRNISGIIVIDFINMKSRKHQSLIRNKLLDECQRDIAKIYVGDFSSLGLVEMTRSSKGLSLTEQFQQSCPVCLGDGVVGDYKAMKQNILTEVMNLHQDQGATLFHVYCSTLFADALCSELSNDVNQLLPEQILEIHVKVDQRIKQASYNLVIVS